MDDCSISNSSTEINGSGNGTSNGHVAVSMSPQLAWRRRARDIVRWVGARLVNRRDVWGQCRDQHRREAGANGQPTIWWTAPRKEERGEVRLTPEVVRAHCLASHGSEGRIVGLHSTSAQNTCKWGALDIDHHGEDGSVAEANWRAAQAWYEQLVADGYQPLLIDSNGAGGFHLMVIFREPVPAQAVHGFLQRLIADHADHGLTAPPETFPKQAELKRGQYGNYLRLPGRHHTRNHWSRVWDGQRWLEGEAALNHMFALQGDSSELLTRRSSPSLERCIRAYMARVPNLAEGEGRDDAAYQFAAFLVRDMALDDAAAIGWLAQWDGSNRPPLGQERLQEIAKNAHEYGRRPVGSGLQAEPPEGGDTEAEREGYTIILDYFRSHYRPVFRRGTALYSSTLKRDVALGEACAGAPRVLIDQLAAASNAPRDGDGEVKLNALPQFFNTWVRSAWVDLLNGLPNEEAAADADEAAKEEFRRLVAQALLSQITLGETVGTRGEMARTERRSLVEWCYKFAKSGPWKSIRSYLCWCKVRDLGGGEIKLRAALRHELFAQLGADRRLIEMGAKKFSRLAALYGVGQASEDERPQGQRAVVLDQEFLDGLLSTPDLPTEPEQDGSAEGPKKD